MKFQKIDYKQNSLPLHGELFAWLWFFIQPFRGLFILLSVNRIVRSVFLLSAPIILNVIVDYVISSDFATNPTYVLWAIVVFFGLKMIAFLQLFCTIPEDAMKENIIRHASVFALEHILSLDTNWHNSQWSGSKITRILQAREGLADLLSMYFWEFLMSLGIFVAVFLSIGLKAPLIYWLYFLLYIVLFFVVAWYTSRKMLQKHDEVHNYNEKILEKSYDFATNNFLAKVFALMPFIRKKTIQKERQGYKKSYDLVCYQTWFVFWCHNFTWLIGFMAIILMAYYHLSVSVISVGTFVMLVWLGIRVWDYMEWTAEAFERFLRNKNAFMRLVSDLQIRPKKLDFEPIQKYPKDWKQLSLKNISFQYEQRDILRNINLSIEKWQTIAFVGPSWWGKSTIAKLLLKQLLPSKWTISLDDIDIKNIASKDWLKHTTAVLQETDLFDISIRENITLGNKLSTKDVSRCVSISGVKDFTKKLDKGIDSIVWERWVKLSGGEKQRVGIARALARDPDIIIFDEPTSALDAKNEAQIWKNIEAIAQEKTAIIIAHRLATVQNADVIYVLKNGKIVESGTCKQLQKKKGLFWELWEMQKLNK